MLNKLVAWLRSKSVTTHTIGASLVGAALLIASDEQVRSFLTSALVAHPKLATAIIFGATTYAKYSHSSSAAGTVANAQNIAASSSAPTPAAVQAANTSAK